MGTAEGDDHESLRVVGEVGQDAAFVGLAKAPGTHPRAPLPTEECARDVVHVRHTTPLLPPGGEREALVSELGGGMCKRETTIANRLESVLVVTVFVLVARGGSITKSFRATQSVGPGMRGYRK